MWLTNFKFGTFVLVLVCYVRECWTITNAQFNASLRDYSVHEDTTNATEVRTLQKDISERYAHQAPVNPVIRFKEVPDSVISGSSHGRGLLHLNHHGYALADYEESPHYGYGYEYQDDHHEHHGHYDDHEHHHPDHHHSDHHHSDHHGHHVIYHDDHKHGYGHHHKHYDHHALAAKTVLWPIAGIALLGAAAALVTNPVLLQLGVVSGRRRRRDATVSSTEKLDRPKPEINDELILKSLNNYKNDDFLARTKRNKSYNDVKRNVFNKVIGDNNHRLLFRNVKPTVKTVQSNYANTAENNRYADDKHYIPIPLKTKENGRN